MPEETKPTIIFKEEEKKIVINPSGWNYTDFLRFSKLSTNNQTVAAFKLAQKVISKWDYDIPVDEENAIAKLPLGEGGKVIRTITETLSKAFEGLGTADVSVDFKDWNGLDWEDFTNALINFDGNKVTEMVHQVASMDDVQKGKTLPLVEGAIMVRAVRERYQKLMSGKY